MPKSFSSIIAAAAAFTVVAISSAHAQGIQEHIPESACENGGLVSNEYVFERALRGHNVTLLQSERANLRRFALRAVELLDSAPPTSAEDRARYSLALATNELVNNLDNPSHERTSATMSGQPPALRDRIVGFLSLNAPWLVITCTNTPEPDDRDRADTRPQRPTLLSRLSGIRIARDLEGARESDLSDRTFATLSGKDDRESDEQTAAFEGLALFPTNMHPFGNAEVETYIGYHRTTSSDDDADEINDLTFGAQLAFSVRGTGGSILPDHHYFDASLDWETDDQFESGVTAIEIAYNPIWGGRFGNERRIDGCLGGECVWDVTGVADFAEVGDPGEKTGLLEIDQYGRVGVNLEAGYYFETMGGEISLTGDYRIREAFTDDGGDAERFVARLAYTPGGTGRVSIGLDYVDGKDLTSFEAEEYFAISIGFRN